MAARLGPIRALKRWVFLSAAVLLALTPMFVSTPSAGAAPAPTFNCTLTVPANPLTAAGLSTPYVLSGDNGLCTEADPNHAAFVQATIVDGAGGLSVYNPLVITAGTTPAAPPVVPVLPADAVVALWAGFNGNTLTVDGPGAGAWVNGLPGSPFGQVAWANGPAFFRAAAARNANVGPLGTGLDGLPCPTTRSFRIVDQDPSDNVTTRYRINAAGQTAQDNAANAGVGALIANGSDNRLLDNFIDPAIGCKPPTAPDLTNPGEVATSQGLNELLAMQQDPPLALVPTNDPMTLLNNGEMSVLKTDLYRLGVGQPLVKMSATGVARRFCGLLQGIAPASIARDAPFTNGKPSPDPAQDLTMFLQGRLAASLQLLGCPAHSHTPGHPHRERGPHHRN